MTMFENDPRFAATVEFLSKIDINTISPVEALLKLNEVKNMLKDKE